VFDHVTVRVSDRGASKRFYELVLGTIGHRITHPGEHFDEWDDFGISQARAERPVTRGLHAAFCARSHADVDAFWRVGVDAGYASGGEPGLRPQYGRDYYGSFLLDPDGNSVEAVAFDEPKDDEFVLDHLWIRVRDLGAQERFWNTIAPVFGFRVTLDMDNGFHVSGRRSFALVHDERPPTENLHVAFPVPTNDVVADFHRVALAAGFDDNGAPGERTEYHRGYYGAFVLDPDGNNVEAVCHNRN
jgi:catechol 2,3-dioxygenase-like lactoylglutathione lyase family enzyme